MPIEGRLGPICLIESVWLTKLVTLAFRVFPPMSVPSRQRNSLRCLKFRRGLFVSKGSFNFLSPKQRSCELSSSKWPNNDVEPVDFTCSYVVRSNRSDHCELSPSCSRNIPDGMPALYVKIDADRMRRFGEHRSSSYAVCAL